MDFILFVWTTDLFDFRISLIFLVELLIYHSFRLKFFKPIELLSLCHAKAW